MFRQTKSPLFATGAGTGSSSRYYQHQQRRELLEEGKDDSMMMMDTNTNNNEDAETAAAEIAKTLENFTSPKLGSLRSITMREEEEEDNMNDWLERQQQQQDNIEIDGYDDYYDDYEDEDQAALPFRSSTRPSATSTRSANGKRRSAILQRADTPVISNVASSSQKKKKKHKQQEEEAASSSPLFSPKRQLALLRTRIVTRSNPSASSSSSSNSFSSHDNYRRYHAALLRYTLAMRRTKGSSSSSSSLRIELEFLYSLHNLCWDRCASASASAGASSSSGSSFDTTASTSSWKEGNFWLLLSSLRRINDNSTQEEKDDDENALLWDDDEYNRVKHNNELRSYLQQLSSQRLDYTPYQLVRATKAVDSIKQVETQAQPPPMPLVLQRRRGIQKWLYECFQPKVSSQATRPRQVNPKSFVDELENGYHNNLADSQNQKQREESVFQDCLSLLLAGRFDTDALKLLRDCGLAGRAAAWGGGKPLGYNTVAAVTEIEQNQYTYQQQPSTKTTTTTVGNPHRALWRRLMWLQSNAMPTPQQNSYQAAIIALLANHLHNAVSHQHLRTWEHGLFSSISCMLDRMEDELLHMSNNNKRCSSNNYYYPGAQHLSKELSHLEATSEIATTLVDERGIIDMLSASPFEEMQRSSQHCFLTKATASVLVGNIHLFNYLQTIMIQLQQQDQQQQQQQQIQFDEHELCFMTHLLLYLDSIMDSSNSSSNTNSSSFWNSRLDNNDGTNTTPWMMLQEWKQQVVWAYLVDYLATREDLWFCLVLYASHLPNDSLLEVLPPLLSRIESNEERKVIVGQLDECLNDDGDDYGSGSGDGAMMTMTMNVQVLIHLVRGVLTMDEINSDNTANNNNSTTLTTLLGGDDDNVNNIKKNTPTRYDVRKMNAVLWLSYEKSHYLYGVLFSNTLLRQFLLADKLASAFLFVEDVLPESNILSIMGDEEDDEGEEDGGGGGSNVVDDRTSDDTRVEHLAYHSYLDAVRAVHNFKTVLADADTCPSVIDDSFADLPAASNYNEIESQIASRTERRNLIKEKRRISFAVVKAAERASQAIKSVLGLPGGWLITTDQVDAVPDDDNNNNKMQEGGDDDNNMIIRRGHPASTTVAAAVEDQTQRRQELDALRAKILPQMVVTYSDVCLQTAEWMYASINDATERLDYGTSWQSALSALDDTSSTTAGSSSSGASSLLSSPLFPGFWTQRGLTDIPDYVASDDKYSIKSACSEEDLLVIMSKLSDATIADLLYTCESRTPASNNDD